MQSRNEAFQQIPKVAEKDASKVQVKAGDKCDGHCIGNKPGTMGHHDNRKPLY